MSIFWCYMIKQFISSELIEHEMSRLIDACLWKVHSCDTTPVEVKQDSFMFNLFNVFSWFLNEKTRRTIVETSLKSFLNSKHAFLQIAPIWACRDLPRKTGPYWSGQLLFFLAFFFCEKTLSKVKIFMTGLHSFF